jgi:hypothetical protein
VGLENIGKICFQMKALFMKRIKINAFGGKLFLRLILFKEDQLLFVTFFNRAQIFIN